jgi:hypothetical protein
MSEYLKRGELEGRILLATRNIPVIEDSDAEQFMDGLIDDVVVALRRDPRFGAIPAHELQLLLGNVRAEAARTLAGLISGLADINDATDRIVNELGEDE